MLSVDVSGLENNVIPQLKTSKEYLRVIQLLIMAINVPDDFSYGSTIHGMPSKISNIVDNLNNIENWIDKHISDFTNAENSNKNMLEKILASIGNLLGDDDKQLLKLLAYLIFNGKDNITEEDYEKARNSLKNFLEMFRYQEVVNGQFGTDQGYFKYVNDPEKLNKYTEYFSKKYNMSKSTAIQIMEYLDSIGACSYADATNLIIQKYQDSPEKFEETFGFPMYSKNEKYPNIKILNGELLLFDMYVWENSKENGGDLFKRNSNGLLVLDNDALKTKTEKTDKNKKKEKIQFSDQKYMTQDNNLSNYLNSKSDNLSCQRYTRSFADINNANDAKTVITNILNNNIEDVQISLGTYNADKEPITYKNVQTGDKYSFYTGHIATIVDYDDKGIYVSTWGEEYFVSYSELYGQENCYIEITNIDMK